jgi:UDP-2-acetamido-2,6-beta-L-arabino-hexul-4-ose reductase
MNVVVTGANGFIGKNLIFHLEEQGRHVSKVTRSTSPNELKQCVVHADFIFHLAGVNRPVEVNEFSHNISLTQNIVDGLLKAEKPAPIFFASSTQADHDNPYGKSKSEAEAVLLGYSEKTGNAVTICRLPNVFGKWCKPNYNSFVATFCHNIANDIPINIHDSSAPVTLVYVDDVCRCLLQMLGSETKERFVEIDVVYGTTVGEVADLIHTFKASRDNLETEAVGKSLTRALYSTYLSYLAPDQFHYDIPSYTDERGTFAEMLKTKDSGQISFFTAHKGVTRGGHYHHTKNEKFLVIKGRARFCFKHVQTAETYELFTSSDKYQIVETVPGWSHDITNVGDDEMLVMLWANEVFDRDHPDTIAMETK